MLRIIPSRSSLFPPVIAPGGPSLPPLRVQVSSLSSSETPTSETPSLLTARERRKLRNERREENLAASGNWREEIEEKFIRRKKAEKPNWKDELNLDNLSLLGPQWWAVRVSRVTGQETTERLARLLARSFPDSEFKVYFPAVKVKNKLKSGTYKVKAKPLFPGCAFLYCVLNKELHDFVRECEGIGGFVGSKVGNSKRQINKPKPVSLDDMEAIFQQAKQEQEAYDQSFEREDSEAASSMASQKVNEVSTQKKKTVSRTKTKKDSESLVPGSRVRVLSGAFMNYMGLLKKVDRKEGKASIGIFMFGKETIVQVDYNEIKLEEMSSEDSVILSS